MSEDSVSSQFQLLAMAVPLCASQSALEGSKCFSFYEIDLSNSLLYM